jgi:hypothetical protein
VGVGVTWGVVVLGFGLTVEYNCVSAVAGGGWVSMLVEQWIGLSCACVGISDGQVQFSKLAWQWGSQAGHFWSCPVVCHKETGPLMLQLPGLLLLRPHLLMLPPLLLLSCPLPLPLPPTQSAGRRVPFAFLEDIKGQFSSSYSTTWQQVRRWCLTGEAGNETGP